ncbi:MAG TPA: DUF3857 domain-containing protein [Bacteroidia bacterium]|nr:DUF3857 domain-containing protein [Bacteroidia bacterium]
MTSRINFCVRIVFLTLLLPFTHQAAAQQPDVNFDDFNQRYPGQDVCILKKSEHLDISVSGGALKLKSVHNTDMLFLTDKASMFLNKSIYYYDHFSDIKDIKANSWIPEGDKYKKYNVGDITFKKSKRDGVFYDDLMEAQFVYPSLKKGAITSLQYTEILHDPHFLNDFYFAGYTPTENSEYRITFPDDMKLNYVIRNNNGSIQFKEERSKHTITYTFTGKSNGGYKREDDAPDNSYFMPHVIVYIDKYTLNNKEVKVLSDVGELYGWYQELLKNLKHENHPELKALADSLTRNASTEREKIKAIYYWVQDQIKYIAFEDGLGGFIPREPIETYNKRFGDCKDKATLLNELLHEAGIKSYPVWIGTRSIPYTYNEVPTPMVDNHMIAAVQDSGKWVFMDATAQHLPYGLPTSMIQGKEGLIGISPSEYKLVTVPETPYETNKQEESFGITLDGGLIKGRGITYASGYPAELINEALDQVNGDKRTEWINKSLGLGNGKYKATGIQLNKDYNNRDSSVIINYDFEIQDFVTTVGDQVYVNLNLTKYSNFEKIDIDKRENDKEIDFKTSSKLETVFKIPEGYEIVKLPSSQAYSNPKFGFSVNYSVTDNMISLKKEVYVNVLTVTKADFNDWNTAAGQLYDASKDLIVLKKLNP